MGIEGEIDRLLRGSVVVVCHHNADPDAICSAFALVKLAKWIDAGTNTRIIYPDTVSRVSTRVMEHYGIKAELAEELGNPDTIIVVDTGNLSQLERLAPLLASSPASKVFLDHHPRNLEAEAMAALYINDESAAATCEIVYTIYHELGFEPSREVAGALLTGLAFDSRHFSLGAQRTFRMVADLLDLGASLSVTRELLGGGMEESERLARLKSAKRMTVMRVRRWLVASSVVGSFQSSAARGMISLGADVAVVAGGDKGDVQASLRSTEEFMVRTGIRLGEDVTTHIAESLGGSGGGHPTAAAYNGKGDPQTFVKTALEVIKTMITISPQPDSNIEK